MVEIFCVAGPYVRACVCDVKEIRGPFLATSIFKALQTTMNTM